MKNEKGITLISLVVYIIMITFAVAGVSAITTNFYSNVNEMDKTSKSAVSYARFNMYFVNDIKADEVTIESSNSSQVTLSVNGETVRYAIEEDGSLYRNRVKICNGLKDRKHNRIRCRYWNNYSVFKNR